MSFIGLRLLKAGGDHRLIAFLEDGVVELEPTEADLQHEAGYYTNDWRAADPLGEAEEDARPLVAPGVLNDADRGKVEAIYGAVLERGKADKVAVKYGAGEPGSRCGVCLHWDAPSACGLVAGKIEASKWCELFVSIKESQEWRRRIIRL